MGSNEHRVVARPGPGGEKRRGGRASHYVELSGDWVVSPLVCATGLSLIARGCLIGTTPRGLPWTSAGTLPQGRNGLSARRMAVLSTFCEPFLRRHVHREFMRSALRDVTLIIPATAYHQRNYVERYSRSMAGFRRPSRDAKSARPSSKNVDSGRRPERSAAVSGAAAVIRPPHGGRRRGMTKRATRSVL